jgi:hypothetical protein
MLTSISRNNSWRKTMKRYIGSILTAILFMSMATVAKSQSTTALLWPNGSNFTTFGPNEAVTIDLGQIKFINSCPSGVDDFIYPFADIYVIPANSNISIGSSLMDVSGAPNTVEAASGGVFVSETIGFTILGGVLALVLTQ